MGQGGGVGNLYLELGQSNSSLQAKSTSEKLQEARPSNNLLRLYNGLSRPPKQGAFNLHCFSSLICAMTITTMPYNEYGGKLKGKKDNLRLLTVKLNDILL